ncbi:MAG: CmpA/NrtA family ABC transporter substrate-binding protein [Pseudomonadota bacterium]
MLEKSDLRIGMARLTDGIVFAIAKEMGAFERQGLNVSLSRHDSWAAIRDQLALGDLDAAHMLSPMVAGSAAGLGPFPHIFATAFAINLNGNAITVSNSLYEQMCEAAPETMSRRPLSAKALKRVVEARAAAGGAPLSFATVYPFSMHAYELRYWMGAAGIDPDRDLSLSIIPPGQMVDSLAAGVIDGYCVGEPWNNTAVSAGLGRTLITSSEIWSNSPEKVLGVRKDWAERYPNTHQALLRALLEAAAWVDKPENRIAAAQIAAKPQYVGAPFDEIVGSLTGENRQTAGDARVDMPDFNVFYRYAANFPWRSHAKWIMAQMIRWGQAPADLDIDAAAKEAFRPDLFRIAAEEMDAPCPKIDEKIEGAHVHSWALEEATRPIAFGPDRFLDGRRFDPADIEGYLLGFDTPERRINGAAKVVPIVKSATA